MVGIDEAGRGPLAGPVTACAAYIPPAAYHLIEKEIDDSKKLSPQKREKAFSFMLQQGIKFGFGYSSAFRIDKINILEATFEAMHMAAINLKKACGLDYSKTLFLIDGPHKIKNANELSQLAIVDGDAKSASIAAASIFAKVTRDRWLKLLDKKYPQYGFAKHKGYGTKAHISAINEYGPCPEHRLSFAPLNKTIENTPNKKIDNKNCQQAELF